MSRAGSKCDICEAKDFSSSPVPMFSMPSKKKATPAQMTGDVLSSVHFI